MGLLECWGGLGFWQKMRDTTVAMDGIGDILRAKDFDTPPEVQAVKEYVMRHYKSEVKITVQPKSLLISARSASLIGSLRLNAPALQRAAKTDKKLIFRIG